MKLLRDIKLLLHFDINKTIIMSDKSAGAAFDSMLNSLLSEAAWGTFDKNIPKEARLPTHWILESRSPSSQPPNNEKDLVTYGKFTFVAITE
jgi:hypothetical protein